jgi:hypothetical protein
MYDDKLGDTGYYNRPDASEDAQQRAVRLNALCRVYEQADRVLTGDPVTVHVVNEGDAPAWSDGEDIYINADMIEQFDIEELVQITGLNYHELAHHLYSPRKGTTLMQWIRSQEDFTSGYLSAANILEDQRIETLLIGRYPAIVPYLTKTTVRWLADSPESFQVNYLSIRGRQYLPLELRLAFRDQFIKPELIPVIAEIVDEYRLLAFPRDYAKAQELIERFKTEVLDVLGQNRNNPKPKGGPNDCEHRDPSRKGRPEPGKAQIRDSERASGIGQKEPVYNVSKPTDGEQSKDNPTEGGDTSNTNNTPGTGNAPGRVAPDDSVHEISAEEALRRRDPSSEVTHTTGANAHVKSAGGIPENIADIIAEIENEIYSRKDVLQDVKAKQRVIIGGDGKHQDSLSYGRYSNVQVPNDVLLTARRFSRELERIKQDLEPTWQREQPSGRINVQRVIKGCDIDDAFDRWDEGGDGTDMEVVLLVDRSGSMCSNHNDMRASEASWVIKRAMEQIDVPVTVYAFDGKTELVYGRDQKASRTELPFIYGSGGTDPQNALIAAERLLASSKRKTKMMFIITDGQFDTDVNDEIIERLNGKGVITVLVMIATPSEMEYYAKQTNGTLEELYHKTQIHGIVETAADLIPFTKPIVTNAIRMAGRH